MALLCPHLAHATLSGASVMMAGACMVRIPRTALAWRSSTITATTLSPEVVLRLRTSRSSSSAAGSLTNCLIVVVGTRAIARSAMAVRGGRVGLNSVSVPIDGFPANYLH
jgi:hypothetical protein